MDFLNAMIWAIGRKSQKTLRNSWMFSTIKLVQTVKKQLKEDQDVIQLFAPVKLSFALFVERNGFLIIKHMVISLAIDLRKLWN